MKFFLDEGLPRGAASLLAAGGIDAFHVTDVLSAGVSDEMILETASTSGGIVVTLDADFHALLAITGAAGPSVIRIRIEGLKAHGLAALLLPLIRQYSAELESGVAMSVDENFVRFQMLPLGTGR